MQVSLNDLYYRKVRGNIHYIVDWVSLILDIQENKYSDAYKKLNSIQKDYNSSMPSEERINFINTAVTIQLRIGNYLEAQKLIEQANKYCENSTCSNQEHLTITYLKSILLVHYGEYS